MLSNDEQAKLGKKHRIDIENKLIEGVEQEITLWLASKVFRDNEYGHKNSRTYTRKNRNPFARNKKNAHTIKQYTVGPLETESDFSIQRRKEDAEKRERKLKEIKARKKAKLEKEQKLKEFQEKQTKLF